MQTAAEGTANPAGGEEETVFILIRGEQLLFSGRSRTRLSPPACDEGFHWTPPRCVKSAAHNPTLPEVEVITSSNVSPDSSQVKPQNSSQSQTQGIAVFKNHPSNILDLRRCEGSDLDWIYSHTSPDTCRRRLVRHTDQQVDLKMIPALVDMHPVCFYYRGSQVSLASSLASSKPLREQPAER
ncbi:Hypothetical protein SMAX5B_020545 [Scophthalmus maximus]|uniref:Uncharacterized protein n=1 Tax=Scophthalmus maximus TaxID=52904 RepID=A0A2U9CNH1_SCOMX|nr:Hypothetical protein SMAX5B_020545 [Scophthalmus maximus]